MMQFLPSYFLLCFPLFFCLQFELGSEIRFHSELNNDTVAQRSVESSDDVVIKGNAILYHIQNLIETGKNNYQNGNYDDALINFYHALEMTPASEVKKETEIAYVNIASIHLAQNSINEATKTISAIEQMLNSTNEPSSYLYKNYYYLLGTLAYQQGKTELALAHFTRVSNYYEDTETDDTKKQTFLMDAEIHKHSGDFMDALKYLQAYTDLHKKSLLDQRNILLEQYDTHYESKKNQQEI